jgi:hypothetical protein
MAPCNLVEADRRFRVAYCLHHQVDEFALVKEAVCYSETSVYFNDTTRRYIPESYHLQSRRRQNLKSHNIFLAFFLNPKLICVSVLGKANVCIITRLYLYVYIILSSVWNFKGSFYIYVKLVRCFWSLEAPNKFQISFQTFIEA